MLGKGTKKLSHEFEQFCATVTEQINLVIRDSSRFPPLHCIQGGGHLRGSERGNLSGGQLSSKVRTQGGRAGIRKGVQIGKVRRQGRQVGLEGGEGIAKQIPKTMCRGGIAAEPFEVPAKRTFGCVPRPAKAALQRSNHVVWSALQPGILPGCVSSLAGRSPPGLTHGARTWWLLTCCGLVGE